MDTTTLINEVRTTGDFDLAAELGVGLMRGDTASFKVGYTFANALNAACECAGIETPIRVAIVAEKMHERLAKASTIFAPEIEAAFPGDLVAGLIADTLTARGMDTDEAIKRVSNSFDYDTFGRLVDDIEDSDDA